MAIQGTTLDCRPPKRWSLVAALLLALATVASVACGPSGRPKAPLAGQQLPPYDADAATLFDDSIAPDVFGASVDGSEAANDPVLASRTAQAESVLPVRVSTVTSDTGGESPSYTLMLQPAGPPLAGKPLTRPIGVEIGPDSPSYAFVHSADSTLVGREFILFFRHYNEQGQTTLHWRGEADTAALRSAVERARLVGGFHG